MYQAYAYELLNQKESKNDSAMAAAAEHPLLSATERLLGALERLERNLEQLPPGQASENPELLKENQELRKERANLDAAVLQLQTQYDDLHHVASTIYNKLEDSIKRLTKIIEN